MKRSILVAVVLGLLLVFGAAQILADSVEVTAYTLTRVRSGPGTDYSIIGLMFDGDTFTANGRSSTSNSWLRIDYNGSEGWVSASVVSVSGDPTTLAVVGASNAEVTVGNTGVTATIGDEAANVRVGPSTSYRAVAQAEAGTTYDVTGRTRIDFPLICRGSRITSLDEDDEVDNVWLRINYGGFNAWVSYSVVSVSGNLCNVEVASVDERVTTLPDFAGRVVIVTRENLNLRASNYPTSEILDTIPYNTTLYPEARDEAGNRIRVTYDDQTGWISISYVDVLAGSISSLPVEEE